jgi:hypothetical protein
MPIYFCREKINAKNMASLTTFLVIGTLVGTALIVMIQRANYRRIIKKKNEGIIKQIYEQNQLQKKMEDLEVEKQVMERMLQKKIEAVVFLEEKRKEDNPDNNFNQYNNDKN